MNILFFSRSANKEKRDREIYFKAKKVLESCQTTEQFDVAVKYAMRAVKAIGDSSFRYTDSIKNIHINAVNLASCSALRDSMIK